MNQTFACTICSLSCFPDSSINFHKQIQLLLVIRIFSSFRKEIFVRIPPSDECCVRVHGERGAGWKMSQEFVFRCLSISALVRSGCAKKEKEDKEGLSLLEIT